MLISMTPEAPNILLIVTDQYNASCLSAFGSQARTPHLDRLAMEGRVFSNAFTVCPICAPARASLLSGQYCHTHGVEGNDIYDLDIPADAILPATLQRSGYRTGIVGKAHLPGCWTRQFEFAALTDLVDAPADDPTRCHYFQYLIDHGLASYYEEGNPRSGMPDPDDGSKPSLLPYEHSIERFTGDQALRFLEESERDSRPLFLKLSFQRPHGPIRPSQRHFEMYNPDDIRLPDSAVDLFEHRFASKPSRVRDAIINGCDYPLASTPDALRRVIASYFGLISAIDEEIGRVLAHLRAIQTTRPTVIIFTADHGEFAGEHGLFHKNLGIYESIHRIPLIVQAPQAGQGRFGGLVELIDIYPTVLQCVGLPLPNEVEGRSLLDQLKGDAESRSEAFCAWSRVEPRRIFALRTDRYRIVYHGHCHGGELYDRAADPGELMNLWDDPAYSGVRRSLTERLLDRVSNYRSASEAKDDALVRAKHQYSPRDLLQKQRADWNAYLRGCASQPAIHEPPTR
ncbi:MAG: sulfatase-like hydrolase/transferase [Candidatus Competibacteraceae bacterium]|nr:sulfatase-like hydrolase/transferase [Candidatus Competibacteraceae bacterium]